MTANLEIGELLRHHRFFSTMDDRVLDTVARQCRAANFKRGTVLARTGQPAEKFFLILSGRIAIETHGRSSAPRVLETLGKDEVFGWSWLFPPFQWTFDAVCLDDARVLEINGEELRDLCEHDPAIGYQVLRRFTQLMTQRIQALRLQLMDVYGETTQPAK